MFKRLQSNLAEKLKDNPKVSLMVCGVLVVLLSYSVFSPTKQIVTHVHPESGKSRYKDGRIFGNVQDNVSEGREVLFNKNLREVLEGQKTLKESNEKLRQEFESLKNEKLALVSPTPNEVTSAKPETSPNAEDTKAESTEVRGHENSETPRGANAQNSPTTVNKSVIHPSIISFPVKSKKPTDLLQVVVPSGSYVKAKLMTGVQAPEGKTYPALLQLDYAFIIPNKKRVDLSGCFMIAKSQGDLSTERVQMQASKLSCVSKSGQMFEREISGFVADDKDNSFAVSGQVSSKQGRVATMAFLSSVVEGVGKALSQAQTTSQTNALGGTQTSVTGDQGTYLAAGGASNAAGLVTQWYLKQAQSLLPTINVLSGQDVWIVLQESVKLPGSFFKKPLNEGSKDESQGIYSYFSRIGE